MKIIVIVTACLISLSGYTQELGESQLKGFASQIELKETNSEEPVSMNSRIFPSPEGDDAVAYLAVKVKVHENWHIYAYVPEDGFFIQSKVKLGLPEGMEANLISEPKTHGYEADPQIMLYKGQLLFVYELKGGGNMESEQEIAATISYQPCDPYACLPPNEITVKNTLTISN
jgi:hypothetical protein